LGQFGQLQGGAIGQLGAFGQFGQAGAGQFGQAGQLGQFGNLGGQFGLQGGNQSQLLVMLIRQVVGTPKDWAPLGGINQPIPGPGGVPIDDPNANPDANDLGYYPPAGALVIKGSSYIHSRMAPV